MPCRMAMAVAMAMAISSAKAKALASAMAYVRAMAVATTHGNGPRLWQQAIVLTIADKQVPSKNLFVL